MNGRRSKEKHRREASERRRAARYKLRHGQSDAEEFGIMAGWAADAGSCPEARKLTHDGLIRLMGDQRAGGVQWLQWSGQDALDVLTQLRRDETSPDLTEYYRRIRRKLEEYGGFLIVAKAPAYPKGTNT